MQYELSCAWGVSPTLARFAQSTSFAKRSLVFLGQPFVAFGLDTSDLGRANTCNAEHSRPAKNQLQSHLCRTDGKSRRHAQQLIFDSAIASVVGKQKKPPACADNDLEFFSTPAQAQPHRANLTLSRISLSSLAKHVSPESRISTLAARTDSKDSGIPL